MMGAFTNILMLMLCIAFVFVMIPVGKTSVAAGQIENTRSSLSNLTNSTSDQNMVVFFGVSLFPNPFSIFNVFFKAIMSFFQMPSAIFGSLGDLPPEITNFLFIIFTVLTILFIVSWFKGQQQI